MRIRTLILGLALGALSAGGDRLSAAPPARKKRVEYGVGRPDSKSEKKPGKDSTTQITIELLTGNEGNGTKAREWSALLSSMDVTLTVRRARAGEKPGVSERKAGSVRTVDAVGLLDSEGRALFPDRVFSLAENDKVAAWLDELRAYGARGKPDGQPVWGLSREQFGALHAALKRPLLAEPRDLDLDKALALFEFPREFRLKLDPGVAPRIKDSKRPLSVGQSLEGVSQGTSLAVILLEHGMGFRPRRLKDGSTELAVVSLKDESNVWPVGWERQHAVPEVAPALFQFKVVNLEDEPLDEVIEAVAENVKMPILLDRAGLAAKGVDFSKLKVTFPRNKTTWINVLKTFTAKAKTELDVRVDESGKPFVWITALNSADRSKNSKRE